ncbi:unnamed protein product [Boreogadus saida]
MAQTNSVGQGTNGVADESPNMIVYRKTHLGRDYFSRLVWLISPGASPTPSFPHGFSSSSSVSELFCSVCAASAQREQRSPGVGVLSFGGNRAGGNVNRVLGILLGCLGWLSRASFAQGFVAHLKCTPLSSS